jgi:hypothetical protein
MPLTAKTANDDRPPIGFCNEPLLGSKYAELASFTLSENIPYCVNAEMLSDLSLNQCLLLVCVAFVYVNRHENVDKV